MAKSKALTMKQRLFLREYFQTGNATASAAKVYNCKDVASAAVIAARLRKKLRPLVQELMEQQGLTLGAIFGTVKEGMKANRVISANIIEGGGGNRDATGMTKDFIEIPDHPTRLKAAKLAGDWWELGKPNVPQFLQQVNISGNLETILKKLEKKRKNV